MELLKRAHSSKGSRDRERASLGELDMLFWEKSVDRRDRTG